MSHESERVGVFGDALRAWELRALSVRQPWAWLIVHGFKHIENRPRRTHIRGPILIHAGLTFDQHGYDWVRRAFPGIAMPQPDEFERGGIVGRTHITDCLESSESLWFTGPFGWVVLASEPLPFAACRGALGFFRPFTPQASPKTDASPDSTP